MYRIGIDLGGTNIAVGVVNEEYEIVAEASLPTGAQRPAEQVVADMCRAVELAMEKAGITAAHCASIGIGSPGTCDGENGVVARAYNLGWFNVPVCAMMTEHFGLPCYLSNDANCAALAETVAGAAVGCRSMVLITLGTGVGGGIIQDGRIISGVGGGRFSPDSTMTRAQFAKIVVCALGLEAQYRGTFADVAESAWYAPYVDTAAAYGIVRGVGDGNFNPDSSITRQESAVMLARAAALCGFDTAMEDTSAVPDTVSDWAGSGVAFCLKNEIMTTAQAQQSGVAVLRCEVAQMLCNLLMQTAILKF